MNGRIEWDSVIAGGFLVAVILMAHVCAFTWAAAIRDAQMPLRVEQEVGE